MTAGELIKKLQRVPSDARLYQLVEGVEKDLVFWVEYVERELSLRADPA